MPYHYDTQALLALTETELLGLYQTLNSELAAFPTGSGSAERSSELLNRVLHVIHYKRRQRLAPKGPRP